MKVTEQSSNPTTISEYTYSAMGTILSERLDTNRPANDGIGDNVVTSADPVFFVATDLSGKRIETYRGTDTQPKEVFYHHPVRVFGSGGGGPMLRTRSTADQNTNNWATQAGSATHDERYYYANDSRGRPMALVSAEGKLVEQYRYSGNGMPFTIPLGDVNADGKVESGSGDPDADQVYDLTSAAYQVRGDLNLDGAVTGADEGIVASQDTEFGGRAYSKHDPRSGSGLINPEEPNTGRSPPSMVAFVVLGISPNLRVPQASRKGQNPAEGLPPSSPNSPFPNPTTPPGGPTEGLPPSSPNSPFPNPTTPPVRPNEPVDWTPSPGESYGNCWRYATCDPLGTPQRPGGKLPHDVLPTGTTPRSCAQLINDILADPRASQPVVFLSAFGIAFSACPPGCYKIAAFNGEIETNPPPRQKYKHPRTNRPVYDEHFYWQNPVDGTWSHKPGYRDPEKLPPGMTPQDANNRPDPRQVHYPNDCGTVCWCNQPGSGPVQAP